jgi:GNAT superfamily N-acetyltransferase
MSRGLVLVRDATPDDAPALQTIWLDFASEYERSHRDRASLDQIVRSVCRLETDPSERLLVATVDGHAVGVAHLRQGPVSPLHDDDAVHVGYLHVLSGHRRRGIGRHLLEAAADWADETDAQHVVASVAAAARDANRFLARLGLGQVAVVRASTVVGLRAKLGASGTVAMPGKVVAANIVAARRLMRRSRARV